MMHVEKLPKHDARGSGKIPSGSFSSCPIDIAVHLLAGKWTIPLLKELLCGPRRPCDLERVLKGISAKTLAERLHELQSAGLVNRTSYSEVPPRVEYSLTELGRDLQKPLLVLKEFGITWMEATGTAPYQANETCLKCPSEVKDESDCPSVVDLAPKTGERKDPSATCETVLSYPPSDG